MFFLNFLLLNSVRYNMSSIDSRLEYVILQFTTTLENQGVTLMCYYSYKY